MAKQTLRFGVFDNKGNRAATWNISASETSSGTEIYLSCRELRGTIHTSFHASGSWHTAYTREVFEEKIKPVSDDGTTRFIEKWSRPNQIQHGVTLAYKIITPHAVVNVSVTAGGKTIFKIPAPVEGSGVETLILLVEPGLSLNIRNAFPVGEITFSNGSKLVVAYHEIKMAGIIQPGSASMRLVKGISKADLAGANLRAVVSFVDQSGNRTMLEMATASEHDI